MAPRAKAFWSRTVQVLDCWIWTGPLEKGYGWVRYQGKKIRAHRCAWIRTYGEIPPGKWVLHHCDTRACVRPDHLYLGTNTENVRDRNMRNRQAKGLRLRRAKWKHQLPGANPHHKKWRAQISIQGRTHYIGLYKSQEEASVAYQAALQRAEASSIPPG